MRRHPRANILFPTPALPVEIHELSEVSYLREEIVRHHLQEWPNAAGRLDPNTWGHLGNPEIPALSDQIPLTLVATSPDGRYIGKGSIIAHDLDHRLYRDLGPWMGGLCVLPEFRGMGVGKKLHFERLRIAAEMGLEELFLFTEQRSYPTVELYRQFGWSVECEIPDYCDGSTTERRWVMTVNPLNVFVT
jgi:GNAT superfamily N-acetyltransferase